MSLIFVEIPEVYVPDNLQIRKTPKVINENTMLTVEILKADPADVHLNVTKSKCAEHAVYSMDA